MEALVGYKLFYQSISVPEGGLAYKLVYQGQWYADELNPNVVWDGIPVAGVGTFNSTFPAPAAQRNAGRLIRLWYASQTMGNTRELFLHLPVAYDLEPARSFPLMVVHDGNESICRAEFDQVADAEIAAGRVAPLVMALVALPSQEERMDEYTFNTATSRGEQYRPFIADELLPFLDAELRLLPDPDQRAVMGASLGGLISYYIGWARPDAFGLVAGMSSSFFWDENWMLQQVQQDAGPLKALRFYLDSADVNDNHDETVAMAQALDARGYPYLHVVQAGASHDWYYWWERFGGMLQYLFPPR
jgi:enterochelin esterase-like enzyme